MTTQDIEALKDQIMKMSAEMQDSICWVVKHMNIVDYMAKGEELSEETMDELIGRALEKKDFTLLAILLYIKAQDKYDARERVVYREQEIT